MKKIKITETQKQMLESLANAKLKLTESGIPPSQSPSLKVTKEFGKAKIKGFTAENNETMTNTNINWNELVINVHEFLKQIYTNPSKEELNPYWETIDVTWDELIQMLTALGIIKSVKGGYRVTKVVDNPAKTVKIVAKLIEKMVKDKNEVPVEETMSNDDIKQSLSNQLAPKPKSGKTRAEILAVIASKRAEELERREAEKKRPIGEEDNIEEYGESGYYPAGSEQDSNAPWNQVDNIEQGKKQKQTQFNILWYHQNIALFEKDGKYYAFDVDSADNDEYSEYADREKTPIGRDEDGDMDFEYGDWEMDNYVVSRYVNSNLEHLSFGRGKDDWESGVEMVEMDNEMVNDFMGLVKYTKGPNGEKLAKILSSMNLSETTSTSSVGGSYVSNMSAGTPIAKSNVASEMKSTIDEVDKNGPLKSDILTSITPFIKNSPEGSMLFWLSNEGRLKEIVDKIQTLGDEEWMLMIQFIVTALQGAETFIEKKNNNGIESFKQSISGLSNFINHFSRHIGEATTVTSVGGDSETFAYDAPVGDGSKFWTAGNKMNKKSVKENAKVDTQYPKGEFVKFDDCTKLNNNKVAQNGGCSTGAVDNVVKTKSSKNSVISDSNVYESVAKATGRTVEDVKTIVDKKINKSN